MSQYGNYRPKVSLYRSSDSLLRLFVMKYFKEELIKDDEFYHLVSETIVFHSFKIDVEFRNLKRNFFKSIRLRK